MATRLNPTRLHQLKQACGIDGSARAVGAPRWPLLQQTAAVGCLAPLIAIVGCDGSGKSTLGAELAATIGRDRPATLCYLGLGSGDIGRKIKQFRLGGAIIERFLAKKAEATRTKGEKIPGLATAIVVYSFSLLRRRRFRQMMSLRRQGVLVVTDRYPQIEVPGFFDGPGLSAARAGSPLVAWLAARERRMYEDMAAFRPDVVIRLDIDADSAFARKPDHAIEQLRAKAAVTPTLRFGGAPVVDLDARKPYPDVFAGVMQAATRVMMMQRAKSPQRSSWFGAATG